MPVETKPLITGRCACGSIRYECTTEPQFSMMCQCRQCQRITGTGHSAQFAVTLESTEIQGHLNTFKLTSDAGNEVISAFCGNCGNPIFKTTSMAEQFIMFHAATLDDPSMYKPQMVVYAEFGHPLDHIDSTLPRKE